MACLEVNATYNCPEQCYIGIIQNKLTSTLNLEIVDSSGGLPVNVTLSIAELASIYQQAGSLLRQIQQCTDTALAKGNPPAAVR